MKRRPKGPNRCNSNDLLSPYSPPASSAGLTASGRVQAAVADRQRRQFQRWNNMEQALGDAAFGRWINRTRWGRSGVVVRGLGRREKVK
jgi:hypothetical protein